MRSTPFVDYPEGGSSARIRISFSFGKGITDVPSTAFFLRLKNELPDGDPIRTENGPWETFEQAHRECWAIAEELDRKLRRSS